jgi:hypothetical protein
LTEQEWLACADSRPMLALLRSRKTFLSRAGRRKLRLYACACCRGVWHLLGDQRSRHAIEAAERHADGAATTEELGAADKAAGAAADAAADAVASRSMPPGNHAASAACAAAHSGVTRQWGAALAAKEAALARQKAAGRGRPDAWTASQVQPEERRWLACLLRDIFGNPFRTVRPAPCWLAWHGGAVPKLAQAIYDGRRFADLPVLADALEEAGCDSADLLAHCRQPGEHVRGCWVVDAILGKT